MRVFIYFLACVLTSAAASASPAYVQFSDGSQTKVVSIFGSPQNPAEYPNQAIIDTGDARYVAFFNPPRSTVISKLAFWERLAPEQVAIVTAAQSNVTIGVWLQTAQAASVIDLADPKTKAGLDALVAAGVLASQRETAVITP